MLAIKQLQKLCSILIVGLAMPGLQAFAAQLVFSDVPVMHPQYEAINSLQAQGVLSGYEDGTFKPERIVTRAEMVKLALGGAGIEIKEEDTETVFKDVPSTSWYAPYIQKASELQIVGGYEDGNFRPENSVNRVEALKMILTAQELQLPEAGEQLYEDVATDAWYAPYVRFVDDYDLLTVNTELFERDKGMRRKDIAEILYKLNLIKAAQQIQCWPIKTLVFACLIWIILIWLNFLKIKASKPPKIFLHYLGAILLAPVAAFYYAISIFRLPSIVKKEREMNYRPSKYERFNYMFRRYVYTKNSDHFGKLVLEFLRINYSKILNLFLVSVLVYFMWLIFWTGFLTCQYKASFPLI